MFIGDTILRRIDSNSWELIAPLIYENEKFKVTLLPGLKTDGASIPKVMWTLIGSPMMGRYVGPALIHDGLYASKLITRREADDLFMDMMVESKVGWLKRHLIHKAVKWFGGAAWASHKEESVNLARKIVRVEPCQK